jgi:hypothetical protein
VLKNSIDGPPPKEPACDRAWNGSKIDAASRAARGSTWNLWNRDTEDGAEDDAASTSQDTIMEPS